MKWYQKQQWNTYTVYYSDLPIYKYKRLDVVTDWNKVRFVLALIIPTIVLIVVGILQVVK